MTKGRTPKQRKPGPKRRMASTTKGNWKPKEEKNKGGGDQPK